MPLEQPRYGTTESPGQGGERIEIIVPYVEQGTIFVDQFTFIITSRRLIFALVPGSFAQPIDEKAEEIDDGWAEYDDLARQRTYLNRWNWDDGPWQVYARMHPDAIAAESQKNIVIPLETVTELTVFIDRETDFADEIVICTSDRELTFTLNYAAGERVIPILSQLLGLRLVITEKRE
jgi:hypothetical protein